MVLNFIIDVQDRVWLLWCEQVQREREREKALLGTISKTPREKARARALARVILMRNAFVVSLYLSATRAVLWYAYVSNET